MIGNNIANLDRSQIISIRLPLESTRIKEIGLSRNHLTKFGMTFGPTRTLSGAGTVVYNWTDDLGTVIHSVIKPSDSHIDS